MWDLVKREVTLKSLRYDGGMEMGTFTIDMHSYTLGGVLGIQISTIIQYH